ncbi:MAG: hypothetical protein V1678_02695 [Candidatus Aenigmatarchaeota archaeon]
MNNHHGVHDVPKERQREYVLELISNSREMGITTGEVIAGYETKYHIAKAGKKRADRKWSIIDDIESYQIKGRIFSYSGRFFMSGYKEHKDNLEKSKNVSLEFIFS